MKTIKVPRESFGTGATVWDVAGQSPANSPQAIIQSAQMFLGILGNPILGPASGLQVHPLVAALLSESPLKNLQGVQLSEDETKRRNAPPGAPPQNGPAVPGGGGLSPNDGGVVGPAGDGPVPALPPGPL